MSMISDADQDRLRSELAAITRPVTLLFFTQTFGCESCLQARQVIDELPPLSENVAIEEVNLILDRERAEKYGIDRVPAIALITKEKDGTERDSRIRFLGTPAGYEFIGLVRAILLVGTAASNLSDESRSQLSAIDRPTTIRVFSTPTCPYCPRAVTLAHEIAWANPNVTAYAIEATEYPDLARQYRVTGVPKTIVNDAREILGAVPEDELVSQVLAAVAETGQADGVA
jgi:glutaredoxin-like protein